MCSCTTECKNIKLLNQVFLGNTQIDYIQCLNFISLESITLPFRIAELYLFSYFSEMHSKMQEIIRTYHHFDFIDIKSLD